MSTLAQKPMYYTSNDLIKSEFVSRGLVLLSPQQLGIENSVHEAVYEQEMAALKTETPISPAHIPAIMQVLRAPGLIAAVDQIIGEEWAIVPFTHNAPFMSGAYDQQWHKDDNGPYNSRKQRHHHSVQLEMLYYPQAVSAEMGPTATMPYAHYWTFNHEENQDNFAGADHLDFDYLLSNMEGQPVSGPDSHYSLEDITARQTAHDKRMRDAVHQTGWPLVQPFEAAPLQQGSVLLYSHNTFHRGNHRRDDWQTWQDNPRFMWRFFMYRCHDPKPMSQVPDIPKIDHDALMDIDLSQVDKDITAVWNYQFYALHNMTSAPFKPREQQDDERAIAELYQRLCFKHDYAEPQRIGAAYRLAALSEYQSALHALRDGLLHDRENVRRAATYGLAACGERAQAILIDASNNNHKWVRKAAVFALGESCPLSEDTLSVIEHALLHEESVYIRSVAAGACASFMRRVEYDSENNLKNELVYLLLNALGQEENRPCMALTQRRSIKMVRPTDDCDVCEGIGIDFGLDAFDPVRSNVRENILWALVMVASQRHLNTKLVKSLHAALMDVIHNDKNVITVGFALDAIQRLSERYPQIINPVALENLLRLQPLLPYESLIRSASFASCD